MRKVIRKALSTISVVYWSMLFWIKLKYNRVSFGRRVRATGPVHLVVHPDGSMRIGDAVACENTWDRRGEQIHGHLRELCGGIIPPLTQRSKAVYPLQD